MKPYFKGTRLKRVKALGYRARRKNNYFQWRDARTLDALYATAGLLVETLGYVFDMEPGEGLTYTAPLVPTKPDMPTQAGSHCAPLVSQL